MGEHDQRLKTLLKAFFYDFFALFLPEYAKSLDFSRVEWLDKEIFADPPLGSRRELDLIAKIPLQEPLAALDDAAVEELLALVHIEIESSESITAIRSRMARYFFHLGERHGLPVLPVVLFLRVGLEGTGVLSHVVRFGALETSRFQFHYVGLPALDGVQYLEGANDFGVALAALMRLPRDARAQLKAESLQRIATARRSEQERYLLAECVEAYLSLETVEEQQEFERLMSRPEFAEAKTMETTTFERGVAKGIEKGRAQGQRQIIVELLEERFGPLSETARTKIDALPADELAEFARRTVRVRSLDELGLDS